MRLTLRTLMAYHHGVLSPADKEDLHHRIQQSEDAGNLLRRIDSLTKQSQLLSPALNKKTSDNDLGNVNSIAEYLDDALKGPKVPELERICLESDIHLAELAHCHELLATAMHTQVVVPQALRQTAINLADPKLRPAIEDALLTRSSKKIRPSATKRSERDHGTTKDAVQVPAPMVASGGESIRPEGLSLEGTQLAHEVPEYLVGSARGRWKVPVAIGALTLLLGVLVWQTLGPWERVQNLLTATPSSEVPAADPTTQLDEPPLVIREEIGTQAEPDNTIFHELVISEEKPPAPAADNQSPPTLDPSVAVQSSDEAPPIPGQAPPAASSSEDLPPIESSDDGPPIPAGPPADGTAAAERAVWNPADAAQRSILASKQGEVTAVLPGANLDVETQLLIAPTAKGEIRFPDGTVWSVGGLTRMKIEPETAASVDTDLCRGMLKSTSGKAFGVSSPLGRFSIQPSDENSLVSIEVAYRRIAHGSVVDRRAYVPVLIIIAAEGTAKVVEKGSADDPNDKSFSLAIGEGLSAVEGQRTAKFRLSQIPNWFRPNHVRPIDTLAQQDLGMLLDAEQSIVPQLEQLAKNRRPETAALAIQTAMLAGEWKPFVETLLNSERLRSHWYPTIEMARQLLAVDPTRSDQLRELMMAKFGVKQGGELFQLLVGIPEDQLAGNGISNLITHLDSEVLANRVLAFYQLQSLTGKQLAYQPFAPNRSSIQQWRREVAMKRLPLVENEPVIERKAN